MSSLNQCTFLGNLGQDPELKFLPSGQAVCNFSMALNHKWKDQQGVMQEKTEWVRIVVWGKMAEACSQYLKKGSGCLVEGRAQTRSWETPEGQKRSSTEFVAQRVQFLGGGKGAAGEGGKTESAAKEDAGGADGAGDDDIPF